jgi:hypothetical protein
MNVNVVEQWRNLDSLRLLPVYGPRVPMTEYSIRNGEGFVITEFQDDE